MSWKTVKLGQFLSPRNEVYAPDSPVISGLQKIDKISFAGQLAVTSYKLTKTNQILVYDGDLVFSGLNIEKGAISLNLTGETLVVSTNYSSFQVDYSQVAAEYLLRFITSQAFNEIVKASLRKDYSFTKPKQFLPIEILLPPLDVQRQVAARLMASEEQHQELLDEIGKQQTLLTALRQAFLREAMQGRLVPQDLTDEPAAALLTRIRAEKSALIKAGKLRKEKPLPPIAEKEMPYDLPDGWV